MIAVAQLVYSLPTQPSVKWLATQERNLCKEFSYPDPAAETLEEYVSRTYLQFLWLPQVRRHIQSRHSVPDSVEFPYFPPHFRSA